MIESLGNYSLSLVSTICAENIKRTFKQLYLNTVIYKVIHNTDVLGNYVIFLSTIVPNFPKPPCMPP